RAGAAGGGLGRQTSHRRADLAAVDVRVGHRGVPGLLPDRGGGAARAAVAVAALAGADAQLLRVLVAVVPPVEAARERAVPDPGAPVGRGLSGGGCDRRGDLDRHPRRDRSARHRVLAGGHVGPGEGVDGVPRRGPARAARPGPGPLPPVRSAPVSAALPSPRAGDGPVSEAVQLAGVGKTFRGRTDVTALADIDLAIEAGEFVTFIGPSGCGKSTLLRLIADLIEPTAGTVTVNGKSARQARLDQDYGIAFQQAGLMEWRTVARNVELPLELRGWDRARRRTRARELLELVGLPDFVDSWPIELSGGMQQRVAIARALATGPKLLLMDEPFGALDEMTRERLQAELTRIARESGATVVFVTHSIPEAVYLSDRVVVLSARPGRVTEIVPVPLGDRTDDTREAPEFYAKVTEVREALRGRTGRATVPAAEER